jgi:hypothetical protein
MVSAPAAWRGMLTFELPGANGGGQSPSVLGRIASTVRRRHYATLVVRLHGGV